MKEWIYKDGSGEYVLTTDPEVANLAADAVEVPEGAELYCFWHADNEKAFHGESGFYIDDHWEDSSWTLSEVKSGESGAKILWQRQPNQTTIDAMNDYKTEAFDTKEMCKGSSSSIDNVNHPSHYCGHPSGIECIEITRHHDFAIGNAIKYLWRAGLKGSDNEVQDLKKAVWYIQDKIKQLESKVVDDKTIDWIDEGNK